MWNFKPEITLFVVASDFKAAADWYTSKLGFQNVYTVDEMGWGEFTTPIEGLTIGIGTAQPGTTPGHGGNATITFGVNDIEAARADLESKGVEFEGPTEEIPGMVKLATFHDLDGNALMLAQSLTQQ